MEYNSIKVCLRNFETSVLANTSNFFLHDQIQNLPETKELKKHKGKAFEFFGTYLEKDSLLNEEINASKKDELGQVWISLFVIFIVEFHLWQSDQPSIFDPIEKWMQWSLLIPTRV